MGKITITCPIEGKVVVDMANVKTFSTDGPIKIVLSDGSVIDLGGERGSLDGHRFRRTANGTLAVQAVPLREGVQDQSGGDCVDGVDRGERLLYAGRTRPNNESLGQRWTQPAGREGSNSSGRCNICSASRR